MSTECSVEVCTLPGVAARGLCWKHYGRLRRHGDALYSKPSYANVEKGDLRLRLCLVCTQPIEVGQRITISDTSIYNKEVRIASLHKRCWERIRKVIQTATIGAKSA